MSRGSGPIAQFLSGIGPGLKLVLGLIAVVGLLEALLTHWMGMSSVLEALICTPKDVLAGQLWRLLTAGVLSDPNHPTSLLLDLAGLYFLSRDLERVWGTRRFLGFVAFCIVAGNVLAVAVDRLAPMSLGLLHPGALIGASAALVGTAIAWGVMNRDQQIQFMMVLPMSGMTMVWVTVGLCGFFLLTAGDVQAFGGVLAGFTLVGEPSLLRRAFLRIKLAFLRRRYSGVPTAHDILRAKQPILKKARGDRPPLRVVSGGLDDPGKREPKDKRYLN
jgi:membrane associated rhomboid family serine protease